MIIFYSDKTQFYSFLPANLVCHEHDGYYYNMHLDQLATSVPLATLLLKDFLKLLKPPFIWITVVESELPVTGLLRTDSQLHSV